MDACDIIALGAICTGVTIGDWIAIGIAVFFLTAIAIGVVWLMHDIMGDRE